MWPSVYKMDNTINYPRLVSLQGWTFPLEDTVFNGTEVLVNLLRNNPSMVTSELLAAFSHYCNAFVYDNYSHQSSDYAGWNYTLPNGVEVDPDDADTSDNAENAVKGYSTSGSGGGCGSSAAASAGVAGGPDRMAGFVSLLITMLLPLTFIMARRSFRRRRA